jgi:dTMP kinase
MRRGLFITFEGPDGTGKSTQIARLKEWLGEKGYDVKTTREPGGTEVGEAMRRILLDSRTKGLAPRAEMALMFASRAQQIAEVIRPNVEAGRVVLCDRFTDSSEAYQGFGRGLGSETILGMHHLVCEDLQPDLTILLMFADPAESLERAQQRNAVAAHDESRFEAEGAAFQRRVAEGFLAIAQREPERVKVIDAAGSVDEVHAAVVALVEAVLTKSNA